MKALAIILFLCPQAWTADIVWRCQDDSVRITTVISGTPEQEASRIKRNGGVDEECQAVAFRAPLPSIKTRRNEWKWHPQRGRVEDPSNPDLTPAAPKKAALRRPTNGQ